jgi:YD repeat-containing protein
MQLKVNTPPGPNQTETAAEDLTLTMTGTDGTQMNYVWKGGAYRCNEIKDTNGNYITVNHDENGLLQSVTDTLGRVVTVNYDAQLYPTSITQTWKTGNGESSNTTHTYAAFTYGTVMSKRRLWKSRRVWSAKRHAHQSAEQSNICRQQFNAV